MRSMPRSSWADATSRAAWVALAASATLAQGCAAAQTCDTSIADNPASRYVQGTVSGGAAPMYASSPWNANWLDFEGGKRYELVHGLGFAPANVAVYLAFSSNGTKDGDVAMSAGDSADIELVDDRAIRVQNNSCSEFWLRVTAWGDPRGAASVDDAGPSPDAPAE